MNKQYFHNGNNTQNNETIKQNTRVALSIKQLYTVHRIKMSVNTRLHMQ